MDKLKRSLGDIGKIAAGVVAGQGLTKLPGLLSDLAGDARQLELQAKKALTVFGDESLADVKAWAQGSAHSMGLTTNQATSLAANFADLLIPMGFARDEAAKMSTDVVGLSGALAEWSGGTRTSAEVADILSKAMLGERDALKGLGISISEADVKQRLAANGADKLTGAALEQAKALATQQLIFGKSTDAQTAFANGSNEAARRQAEMSARINEAKEQIATGILPVYEKVTTVLATEVIPAGEKLIKFFQNNKEAAIAASVGLGILLAAVMPIPVAIAAVVVGGSLLLNHWSEIRAKAEEVFSFVQTKIEGVFNSLPGPIQAFISFMVDNFQTRVKAVIDSVVNTFNIMKDAIELVMALLRGDWERAWDEVKSIGDRIVQQIVNNIEALFGNLPAKLFNIGKEAGNALLDGLKSIPGVGAALDAAGGIASAFNSISPFAEGGTISRGQLALVGERGPELFIPSTSGRIVSNRNLTGSPTIVINIDNFHGNPVTAEREVQTMAFAAVSELRARGATI